MDVTVKNLSMQFNDAGRVIKLFDELDFSIPSGERRAIIGSSGVGKTTLLYLLGGLELPVSGDVLIGDTNITQMQRDDLDTAGFRGKHISFVFQFHQLLPEFDAIENAAMPLLVQGVEREEALDRGEKLLRRVGLSERLSHRPGMLSGGEQQRVALARALAARPGVILADEPTGNLDPTISADITDLLLEIQQEEGITLVVVTHSITLAERIGNVMELTSSGMRMQ
jgi:lipoprotein-releasing system ATP-binding protein